MQKIYLDMNLFVQLKNGRWPLLYSILKSGKYTIYYSTAHIGDIVSDKIDEEEVKLIKTDLDFISEITSNNCFVNTGNDVIATIHDPMELFESRMEDKDYLKDFSFDKLFENMKELTELDPTIKEKIDNFKNMPLLFGNALNQPDSGQLEKLFPGLKDNPTMGEFFKSFGQMLYNLNNSDSYNDLRGMVQTGFGINRDKMFNAEKPFEQIQKFHDKQNLNIQHPSHNNRSGPHWFNEITDEYLKLDIYGFQEDKIKVTDKEASTFKNTTQDTFHAAFASRCDIYITNDRRAYRKTNEVYKKLKISTAVYKPEEFLETFSKM